MIDENIKKFDKDKLTEGNEKREEIDLQSLYDESVDTFLSNLKM